MNFFNAFIEVSMSENDRKLLIVLMVLLILVFILLGLLGMLIRFVMIQQGKRMDYYMHDPVVYRVIADPEHFKKYGFIQNNRLFYHQAIPPFIIALLSLLFYIVYGAITKEWTADYFGRFSTLFFRFDWANESNFATFWGVKLLAKWPSLVTDQWGGAPTFVPAYWASYILVPLWLVASIYYLVDVQAYIARSITISRRASTVYEKSLEGYNYYDTMTQSSQGIPQAAQPGNVPPNASKPHP